ncbi:hypothetical protein FACS189446_7210 [Bacteroidia bacterium]|nr:hypothetical protein FACS189446_7210 [Bacteroidia bacterium]
MTNSDGKFTLTVPSQFKTLIVRYLGLENQEVKVASTVSVILNSSTLAIDEVVVVGYGTQRKKDVTSAVARIGGDEISNLATPSFESQLAGRAAGVQVTTADGMLGRAPTIC